MELRRVSWKVSSEKRGLHIKPALRCILARLIRVYQTRYNLKRPPLAKNLPPAHRKSVFETFRSQSQNLGSLHLANRLVVIMADTSLPFLTSPPDTIRDGLVTLKDGARSSHPVEVIQNSQRAGEMARLEMLQNVYGSGLPARMQIERQLLDRVQRLPGIPSSKLGLESLTGELDDFSFGAYLSLPDTGEINPPDVHTVMEKRLGMNK